MLSLSLIVALVAQAPEVAVSVPPRIGYVYPTGAKAGTTVDVVIGGYDWTPDVEIVPHDPRVKIEATGPAGPIVMTPPPYWFGLKAGDAQPPLGRLVPVRFTLPADLKPGPIRFQVANANGGSAVGTFIVGDTAEVAEPVERSPQQHTAPIELPDLPVAASGRITRITESDVYRFRATKAGLTVLKLNGGLGQPFTPMITLRDAGGRVIADAVDTLGTGAVLRFTASVGAQYELAVTDADHAGDSGFVYRLTIDQKPQIVTTVPLVVARGKTTTVDVVGWGVKTGANQLETVSQSIAVPASAGHSHRAEFNLAGARIAAEVAVADEADLREPPDAATTRELAVPSKLSGVLGAVDAKLGLPADRYRLSAKKGEVIRLEAQAGQFGSPVDPSIAVVGADGVEIIRNDDATVPRGAPPTLDAVVDFRAPADGAYDVIVIDNSGTAPSPVHNYRLLIENAETALDFVVHVPDRLDVAVGETLDVAWKTTKVGAWPDAIVVRLENLPDGVTRVVEPKAVEPPTPPGQKPKPVKKPAVDDVKFQLTAAADAGTTSRLANVVASVTVGDRTVERRFGPVLVTAKLKARSIVKSAVQDGGRIVNRGTTYPAEVIVVRTEGYEGPVTLEPSSTQARQRRGVIGPAVEVPAGADRALYPVTFPEWMETNLTTRINLVSTVVVADPKGRKRYVMGAMDGQVVMSPEGALLKVSHEPQERRVAAGGVIEVPVKVARHVKLQQPAKIEVVPDFETGACVTADALTLAVDQSTAVLKLRVASDPQAVGVRYAVVRATALQDGRWPAVSETRIPLIVEAAKSVAAAK